MTLLPKRSRLMQVGLAITGAGIAACALGGVLLATGFSLSAILLATILCAGLALLCGGFAIMVVAADPFADEEGC